MLDINSEFPYVAGVYDRKNNSSISSWFISAEEFLETTYQKEYGHMRKDYPKMKIPRSKKNDYVLQYTYTSNAISEQYTTVAYVCETAGKTPPEPEEYFEQMSETDLLMWDMSVSKRIRTFLDNSVTKDFLEDCDSTDGLSAILQMSIGRMILYDNRYVDHVDYYSMALPMKKKIAETCLQASVIPYQEYCLIDTALELNPEGFECWYDLKMYPGCEDKCTDHFVPMADRFYLTADQFSVGRKYMDEMIKNKAKVMTLP